MALRSCSSLARVRLSLSSGRRCGLADEDCWGKSRVGICFCCC